MARVRDEILTPKILFLIIRWILNMNICLLSKDYLDMSPWITSPTGNGEDSIEMKPMLSAKGESPLES